MKPLAVFLITLGTLITALAAETAFAQTPPAGDPPSLTEKLNAYVGCINRLSERSHDSRRRYFSWVGKNGPTGKERIIYGTYTIYDTSDCRKNVEKANALEPRDAELEAAASAYADAVSKLEPLLKEADDYYKQEDYKDDRMAKGRAMHPRLVAAWDAFANADKALRAGVESINDRRAAERLAAIEQSEGKKARYHVEAVMIGAKRVLRSMETDKPNVAAMTLAVSEYEALVKSTEKLVADGEGKIGSFFIDNAKSYLVTAKQVMRRIRDKVPYSQGDKMMLGCRRRLDGRGLATAADARLQPVGRKLQSRRQGVRPRGRRTRHIASQRHKVRVCSQRTNRDSESGLRSKLKRTLLSHRLPRPKEECRGMQRQQA